MGTAVIAAAKWLWNNKLVALLLVSLLLISMKLAFTSAALSARTKKVAEQEAKITELILIQKEDQANLAALKLYAAQMAEQKQAAEKVNIYLSNLSQKAVEALESEEIKNLNHCLFSYFRDRMLPESCGDQAEGARLSGSGDKAK